MLGYGHDWEGGSLFAVPFLAAFFVGSNRRNVGGRIGRARCKRERARQDRRRTRTTRSFARPGTANRTCRRMLRGLARV